MLDLKLFGLMLADFPMSNGKSFHNLAAATAKVMSPYL